MSDPITRPEFELLKQLIENGFEGVHSRLDKLNGRVDRHDGELRDHDTALHVLNVLRGRVNVATAMSILAGIATVLAAVWGFHW